MLSNLKLPLHWFWIILGRRVTQNPVRQTMSLIELPELTIRH